MQTKIDLTNGEDYASVMVKWLDGNGVKRNVEIRLIAGNDHGLLCVYAAGESLAYLTEKGSVNEVGAAPYAKTRDALLRNQKQIYRTNTFEHLESLCHGKGIVCERNGRKIELTTPDGGTTAECDSVSEALDTYRNDATFSKLPIKL
jgi:hypothetical protein